MCFLASNEYIACLNCNFTLKFISSKQISIIEFFIKSHKNLEFIIMIIFTKICSRTLLTELFISIEMKFNRESIQKKKKKKHQFKKLFKFDDLFEEFRLCPNNSQSSFSI